jgi:hypothetical protein
MNIPAKLLKQRNFAKSAYKNNNQNVFQNKGVNKNKMPLLYNIELGIQMLNYNVDGQEVMRRSNASTSLFSSTQDANDKRPELAKHLLQKMGISYTYIPNARNYSLLRANSNKPEEKNPNILDAKDFANTSNEKSPLTRSGFLAKEGTQAQDPIYNLDPGNNSVTDYAKPTDEEGRRYQIPDLSRVASSIVKFNLSEDYPRQTKYFMQTERTPTTLIPDDHTGFAPLGIAELRRVFGAQGLVTSPAFLDDDGQIKWVPRNSPRIQNLSATTTSVLGGLTRPLSPRRQGLMSSSVPGGPDWDLSPRKGY